MKVTNTMVFRYLGILEPYDIHICTLCKYHDAPLATCTRPSRRGCFPTKNLFLPIKPDKQFKLTMFYESQHNDN